MLRFISFGSGSSGNCYLLQSDSDTILLDSGVGIRTLKKYFKDYGLSFADISAVVVTHDHADHVKSVGALSNMYNIPVYATELVHGGIQKNYCVRKKIEPANRRFIEKGVAFEVGGFRITPFGVPHDSKDNVGYRIETCGKCFCLMTDIGHVTDEIRENISAANYLVIESNHDGAMLQNGPYPQYLKNRISGENGHLSNAECAAELCANYTRALKHVWLCHLSEENNHPELVRKTMEQAFADKGIAVGSDIQVDVLKRKQPSGFYEL